MFSDILLKTPTTLCILFFITLFFHFCFVSKLLINKLDYENKYHNYSNEYLNYSEENFNYSNKFNNFNNIISSKIDIKYVVLIVILILAKQKELISLLNIIIFTNSYIQYMIIFNKISNKTNFNQNISLMLFLCVWISINFLIFDDTYIPYLMSIGSGCLF